MRKKETGKEEVVNYLNGRLLFECGYVRKWWQKNLEELLRVKVARG